MTRTSAHPTTGTDALTAKPAPSPAVTLPKRDARHIVPPKSMNMAVRHVPPSTPRLRADARTRPPPRNRRAIFSGRNAGARAAASPGKASLDAFVAVTSAEAVSLVGRAALALGNAVVDGIEGTADFVQHAAKQADRIAHKAASPTPGGRGVRGALAVLSPSGGIRRGSGAFNSDTGSPLRRTTSGHGHEKRVLGLGKDRSPLKKTGVGGGFRSPAKAARAPRKSSRRDAISARDASNSRR